MNKLRSPADDSAHRETDENAHRKHMLTLYLDTRAMQRGARDLSDRTYLHRLTCKQ